MVVTAGLRDLRRDHEFDVVGPNCMGVLDLVTGAAPYIGSVSSQVPRGTVAVIAQSGAVVEAFVNCGGRVALSTAVSSGSETVTSLADYLNFFAEDVETTAVLAFVETLSDAEAAVAAVRRCSNTGKPVAACVVGRSDRRSCWCDGAFRKAGAAGSRHTGGVAPGGCGHRR
jgi:acetate---CoA ligase (ADP-forming)